MLGQNPELKRGLNKLKVPALHCLGNPIKANRSLRKHLFSLQDHCPEHNYLHHEVSLPFPEYRKEVPFHAIVLDTTFMGERCFDPSVFIERALQALVMDQVRE